MITYNELYKKYYGPTWPIIVPIDEYRELTEWVSFNTGQGHLLFGRKIVKAYGS